jgi:antitoxin component of MazEF toxin-antitoxin module
MAKHSVRKLFLFGKYSLALLLPKKWLTELSAEEGEKVELEFDKKRRRIVIRFQEEGSTQIQEDKSDPPPKDKDDSSWQPIPQL